MAALVKRLEPQALAAAAPAVHLVLALLGQLIAAVVEEAAPLLVARSAVLADRVS